jgi:hypothetical protein
MYYSPAKCYKDLMVEYLEMSVGGASFLPGLEDYHPEYLEEYSIEELEDAVRKFSKKGHTYFAFMAGMVFSNCMETWGEKNEELSEEENDEFIDASQAGLTSFMALLGIDDLSMEEMFEMFDLDNNCDCLDEEDLLEEE